MAVIQLSFLPLQSRSQTPFVLIREAVWEACRNFLKDSFPMITTEPFWIYVRLICSLGESRFLLPRWEKPAVVSIYYYPIGSLSPHQSLEGPKELCKTFLWATEYVFSRKRFDMGRGNSLLSWPTAVILSVFQVGPMRRYQQMQLTKEFTEKESLVIRIKSSPGSWLH